MGYRLIIFDFDGTLADSAPWFITVLNSVAQRFGFRQVDEAEIADLRGRPSREVMRALQLPAWKLPFIAAHVRKLAAAAAPSIELFPGVADMLRQLAQRGVKVAIVSSNAEATVRRVLGPELAGLVAHYGCGASVFGKAAKFREVIRKSGVSEADVLSVGDEVRDIEAARKLRLATGAVTWGYATPEILRAQRPSAMFETTDDVLREAGLCGI
ncbi:HAD family hydrolase [Phenylobacterium sp. Root77]|uniref:HAD hydrolase-like protein n=1 Tax=unclassified Phenylobacterium TaxID=2640670 RepID=UPI0006F5C723|nr:MULTISPECIES: HAD hydrolase-like protein [unclassified Phenylobacterium]KQW71432.1 HAD family hydrolase [Phenylobacterium sp. Root1277]KQW94352.1 HAD family hydrolase [Phenylobacterium sp. Root1290]KRC44046.1 HAD family hydrolase [Phenylobacterium sp. Root77]